MIWGASASVSDLKKQGGMTSEDQAAVLPPGIVQSPHEYWRDDGLLPDPTVDVLGGHDLGKARRLHGKRGKVVQRTAYSKLTISLDALPQVEHNPSLTIRTVEKSPGGVTRACRRILAGNGATACVRTRPVDRPAEVDPTDEKR